MTALSPRHIPVLGREVIEWLSPHSGGVYVDATFGAGGYSRALLAIDGTRVIGIDRDRTAIASGFCNSRWMVRLSGRAPNAGS